MRLNIRFKILFFSAILLLVLIGLLYPVTTVFVLNSYSNLEDEMASQDMRALEKELDNELDDFHHFSKALSSSDDTYMFSTEQDPLFNENFTDQELIFETFERYRANLIVILDSNYEVLYKEAYDLQLEMEDTWPSDMDDNLKEGHHLFDDFTNTRSENSGYLLLNGKVYMISSRPILTTNDQGPLNGAVVMGRHISRNVYLQFPIRDDAHLDMDIVSDRYHPDDFQRVIDSEEYERTHIQKLNDHEIAGYFVKKDMHGDPIFIYKVTLDRDVYEEGFRSFEIYFIIMVVVLVVGVLQFAFINERIVISRLTSLSNEVLKISESNDPSQRVKVNGKDEIRDLGKNINSMLSAIQRSQSMMRESEEKYRKLATMSPTGIVITIDKKIDFVNDTAVKITGSRDKSDLLGKNILDLVPPDHVQAAREVRRILDEQGQLDRPVTVKFTTNNGRYTEMEILATRFRFKNRAAVMYIFQDVTERNLSRRQIEERERRYRTLFEMSADAIFLLKDGIITDCNRATLDLFQCDYSDMIGISPVEISPEHQSDGKRSEDEVLKSIGMMMNGKTIHREWDHMTFKGKVISTELSMKIIDLQGEKFIFSIVHDITDRKRQEDRIREERNRAELYLDLLGHDMGNINQGINSSLEMALCMEDENSIKNFVGKSKELVERSMKFIKYVKILSKPEHIEKRPVDLVPLMEDGINKALRSFPSTLVDLRFDVPENPIIIDSNPIIEEVFFNITHNAIKAQSKMKDPRVDILVKNGNGLVSVIISDHGPGISDDRKKRLFERLKSGGSLKFTGLGLSIVKNLMDRCGEDVQVKDRIHGDQRQGARFILRFRKATEE